VTGTVQCPWMNVGMQNPHAKIACEDRWTANVDMKPMTGVVRHRIFTGEALPFPRSVRGIVPARRGEGAWCRSALDSWTLRYSQQINTVTPD